VEEEIVLRIFVERREERDSLDVVPVEMGDKDVSVDRLVGELRRELLAEVAETCAAIEYVDLSVDTDLYAGGVASVPHVLHLWSGRGTPHTPELYVHALPKYSICGVGVE
jgi:hypothetical protein